MRERLLASGPRHRLTLLLLVVGLVLVAAFPLISPPIYFVSLLFTMFMYIALAESWNILGGYAGYISFGHVAFYGLGAYGTALLARGLGLSAFFFVPLGGLAAALFAAVVGYPSLRLKGPYFAVLTVLYATLIQTVVTNTDLLGGATGIWVKPLPVGIEANRAIFFEVMLALALGTTLVARWVQGSKFGAGLVAIREDEDVAQAVGVHAPNLKLQAFVLSAFLAGVAGGVYAYYISYLHPDITFNIQISLLVVLMALFGGTRSWQGPILGAVILSFVNELLSTFIAAEVARILYGLLFVVLILFMPNGIFEYLKGRVPWGVTRSPGHSPR
jgi:branched-chain amino acid transport system permease protein